MTRIAYAHLIWAAQMEKCRVVPMTWQEQSRNERLMLIVGWLTARRRACVR